MRLNRTILRIQFAVFVGLFLLAEIVLRFIGMKAGTLIDDFIVEDKPVYQPRFLSDENGINRIIADTNTLMLGSVINKQGFRGNFDYTPLAVDSLRNVTKQKVIMVIGDSYVEGCCADTVTNSFPDLVSRNVNYEVLNFGVAGTDPLQYALIAEKYVEELRPDKVVVVVYLGNDIIVSKRTPTPGIPLSFPFKNNKWLFSITPDNLSGTFNYVLKTPEEAYKFYLDKYTLKGKTRNLFEKTISFSVIFSKLYLFIEHKIATKKWQSKNPNYKIDVSAATYENLKRTQIACQKASVPLEFLVIPAPLESKDTSAIREKYSIYFKNIPWFIPSGLEPEDYDGLDIGNHFNNQGHQKYAKFLLNHLD
jgi:hypothetical protein